MAELRKEIVELKVLICGDVHGYFKALFSRVQDVIEKKYPFQYLFCVGDFFGCNSEEIDSLKSGLIKVPIPTYVLGPNKVCDAKHYSWLDSVPNLTYLGKKGVLSGISGLKVAYLSGKDKEQKIEETSCEKSSGSNLDDVYFSKNDIDELLNSVKPGTVIDILLTSQCPKNVTKYAFSAESSPLYQDKIDACSSPLISYLAKKLQPRMHFCGLAGVYHERIPYMNTAGHFTRFFTLAQVNNVEKEKWMYAFSVIPSCLLTREDILAILPGYPTTACPYGEDDISDKSSDQFFFKAESSNQSRKRPGEGSDNQMRKKMAIDSSSCWFCFTNSKVEKHLIIHVGTHCYLALPKGALVPGHVLIIPIKHAVSSVELLEDVYDEVEKFKKSLTDYFHDKDKDVVFFERNYSSPHLQIQVIPVPKQLKEEIVEALLDESKEHHLEFNEVPDSSDIKQVVQPKTPYFYFELMENKKIGVKYLHIIKEKFPLQFGRSVLASPTVLNVTERIDWKKCEDSKIDETEMAENMKKEFEPYKFT